MHILIYTLEFPPFLGTAGVLCHELARGLAGLGVQITVLTRGFGEADDLVDGALEFDVIRIPARMGLPGSRLRRSAVRALWKVLRRQRPDIVLVGEARALGVASDARLAGGLRYAVMLHGTEIPSRLGGVHGWRDYLRWRRIRDLCLGASHLVAVGSHTSRLMMRYMPEARAKVSVVPRGVDADLFAPRPNSQAVALRSTLGLDDSKIVLSFLDSLPNNRSDVLLRALHEVSHEVSSVFLLYEGEGSHRAGLMRLAQELGIAKNVGFLGRVPRTLMPDYYRMCDLCALVSNPEPFGFTHLEACACGKVVLGVGISSERESLFSGMSSEAVQPNAEYSIAEEMIMLLTDDARRRQLGLQGRQLVLESSTLQHMAGETLQVLQS